MAITTFRRAHLSKAAVVHVLDCDGTKVIDVDQEINGTQQGSLRHTGGVDVSHSEVIALSLTQCRLRQKKLLRHCIRKFGIQKLAELLHYYGIIHMVKGFGDV